MKFALIASVCITTFAISTAIAQNNTPKSSSGALREIVDRASYEFYNEDMYRDQTKWIGQTVSFRGTFALHPDILNTDQEYDQISGSNANGDPVAFIVFHDKPVLSSKNSWEAGPTISSSDPYRVFGIVQKCREVITRNGMVRVLPILDLLLVFRPDDQTFQQPVWVSKSLQH